MKQHSSTTTAAETSAGNQDITMLARLAGLPHRVTISQEMAARYAVTTGADIRERIDLYDLVWATRAALSGTMPARSAQIGLHSVRYFFDFYSYRSGEPEPAHCVVTAEVSVGPEPGRLHLCLPHEEPATVLVVEDNRDVAELMELMLQSEGFQVLLAHTAAAGISAARQHLPDVVVLDFDLPDSTGEEVLRALAAESTTKDIPAVFCSGRLDIASRVMELGAVGFLRKPDDLSRLAEFLREVLQPNKVKTTSDKKATKQ